MQRKFLLGRSEKSCYFKIHGIICARIVIFTKSLKIRCKLSFLVNPNLILAKRSDEKHASSIEGM